MELEGKPDFEKALERFEAWWHGDIVDRPPVTVNVHPDRPPRLPESRHACLRDRWMDVEHNVACAEANVAAGVFLAETFPRYTPELGPELCATVFGGDLEFTPHSSFSIPIARSCRDILRMKPDLDTTYWNTIRAMTDLGLARGRGKWITTMPDLHTNGDLVAALRNPQDMALDMADDLEGVHLACDYVNDVSYALMFEDLWNRIHAAGQPCSNWTPTLHGGPQYTTSCDFICMISPQMFQEAVLPSIVWEMRYLARNIFHLDGPGALRHLDALLAQPQLNAVQWIYGAGHGPAARWIDVYKRIQAAGKGVQLLCEDLADARAVAEHLKPEGVWFNPGGSYPRAEAEAFIDWAARWAAGKA